MKAAVYDRTGPPSVLHLAELPDPTPGPGEVLVRVGAVSIEGGDLINRRGGPLPHPPHVVGYAAAGTVVAVGDGVDSPVVGQRVAAFHWSGSHAELMVTRAAFAYPLPEGLDDQVGAMVPVAFGTAEDALFTYGGLRIGQRVLVRGATGGVGIAAVQLARLAGATVIGTATGDERAAALRELGADHVVDGRDPQLADRLREITERDGVDLVLDLVGGEGLGALLPTIRQEGRLIVAGAAGGAAAQLDLDVVMWRRLTVTGVLLGREMHLPRVRSMLDRLLRTAAQGRIRMPIDRVFPLAEAAAAHAHAEDGRPWGRVLLQP